MHPRFLTIMVSTRVRRFQVPILILWQRFYCIQCGTLLPLRPRLPGRRRPRGWRLTFLLPFSLLRNRRRGRKILLSVIPSSGPIRFRGANRVNRLIVLMIRLSVQSVMKNKTLKNQW